jgi:hypothetical protein
MASRVLENRKVKIILIAAATLFAIYLAIGSWVNRIYVAKQTVDNAWTALKQNCDHRVELLSEWGSFMIRYSPEATATLQELKNAYALGKQENFTVNILHQKDSLQRFVNVQQSITLSLQKLYAFISSQPTLLANPDFKTINNDTEVVEIQIVYTAKRLNESIAGYNDIITTVPGRWVNIYLKYPPFFTFTLPASAV